MDNAPNWFRSSTSTTSPRTTTPQTPTPTPTPDAADSSIPSPSTPSSSSMTKAEGLVKMEEITRKVNRKIARKEARISKNAGSDTNSPASTVTTPAAKDKSKSSSRRRTRDEHHDRLARGDSPPGHPHSAPPPPRPPPPQYQHHHSSSSSSTPAPPGYDPLYDVHQSQYPPYQPHLYQPHPYPPHQYQDQPQQQPTTVPRPQASHLPREEDTVWFLCGHLLDVGKAIGTAFVCMFRFWWWLVRSDWKFLYWLWCWCMSDKDDLRSDHLGRGGGGRHDGWSDGNDGRGRHDGGRTEEEKEKSREDDHVGWLKRCSQVYEAVWQRKEPQLNHYTPTKVIMSSSSTRTLPQEPPQSPRNTSPQSQEATPLFMPPQYQQHTNSGTLRQRIHTPSAMAHTPDPAYAPPPPAQPPSTPAPLRRRRLSSCTRILVGTGILIPISIFIILLSLFLPPPTPHNPHLPIDNLLSAISHTSTALELLTETANRRSDSNVFACGMIETAAETIAEPRTHAPIRRAFRALADEGGWACPDTLNYTKAKPVDLTLTNLGVALAEELWTMTTLLNRSVITSQELAAESEHIAARIRKAAPRSELCRVVPLQSHAIAVSPRPQTSWMTTFLPWTTPSPPTSFSSSSPPIHDSAALNYELDYLNITLSPAVASQAHTFAQLEKVGRQCLQRWNAWTAYVPLERLSPERGLYTMQNIEALCREFVREEDVPLPDEAVGGHANHPSSSSSSPNEIMHELTEKVVGAQKRKSSSLPLNVRAQEAFERARRRLLEVEEEEEEGERHRQMEPVEEEEEEARCRALGGGMQSHGFNWLAPSPHREKSAAGGWWLCLWRWLIDRIDWRQSQTGSTAAAAKRRDAATRRRRCRVLGVEEDMSKKKKQESRGGYDYDYHHDGDDDDDVDDDDDDDDGHGPVETLQVTCRRWSLCARQAGQFRRVGGGGSTATDRAAAAAAAAG
ncbi:unnamed protein product [Zymoseptoria tritici ST99CH_1A5]|uniref:Uncharacterized protein n=1 Tax=Zymoseptoria tritici ST99CH_1A5 TaxID=1276529 RepID=A0A1Y6M0W8_ZYMTR|nr:unnamed protein product [Zymoseptoria tritici ST99CH_1A5]